MNEKGPILFSAPLTSNILTRVEHVLTDEIRSEILTCLNKRLDDESAASFLNHASLQLGKFKLEPTKLTKRKLKVSLRKLEKQVEKFRNFLEDMHPEFDHHINFSLQASSLLRTPSSPTRPSDTLEELKQNLATLGDSLPTAFSLASQKNGQGRPSKGLRQIVIREIIKAHQEHFGELPTSTKGGAFEKALRLMLEAVGLSVEDSHRLVLKGLKEVKKEQKPSQK